MKEESKVEDVKNVLEPLDEKQKLFACPQCPIKFERNKSRSKHVRECHSKTTCHFCYSSYDEITIKKHIELYHSSFKCSECGKAFTGRGSLSYHYSRYHSEIADKLKKEMDKCHICGKQFECSRRLSEHTSSVHFNKMIYCKICGAKFIRTDRYEDHVRGVHGTKQKCKRCDFKGYKDELKEHNFSHVGMKLKSEDSETVRYSCLECGATFSRKSDLMGHDQTKHKGVVFPCSQCHLNFPQKHFLGKHIKEIHPKTMCYICYYENSEDDEEKIKSHIENHHSTLTCGECGHISTTKSHLSLHMKSYHIEGKQKVKKEFKCTECEKTFIESGSLKQHQLLIHLKMWYKCKFCNKKMKTRQSLKIHEKLVHKTRPCKEKDCKFQGSKSELEEHIQKNHMLQCQYCDYFIESKTSNQLELSMSNHVRLKHSFPCNLCLFEAKDKGVLKEHRIKEHKKEKLRCDVCGHVFLMFLSNMEDHMLKCWTKAKTKQCGKCEFKGTSKQMKIHAQTHILNCESCEFKTSDTHVLDRHVRKHVKQAKKASFESSLFYCSLCDYKSTEKIFINMHLKNIHKSNQMCEDSENDKKENCEESGDSFKKHEDNFTKDKELVNFTESEDIEDNLKIFKTAEESIQQIEENFKPVKENIQPMEENFPPNEENFQPMGENFQPVEETFLPNQEILTNMDIEIIKINEGVEKRKIRENDKIMSIKGNLNDGQWTCKLRNLQIFPVNQEGSKTKETFQEKEFDVFEPIKRKLTQHDDVFCPVDDTEQFNENLNETPSTEASMDVSVETQIPEDIISTEKECSACGFSTDDEELYNHHQVTDHLLCYICGFTSEHQMFIFSHMKAIHNMLDFEEEGPQISQKRPMTHPANKKPSECPICLHKSESKTANERHHSEVHKGQTFKCARCGSRASRFKAILRHYQSYHDKEINTRTVYDESAINNVEDF